MSRTLYLVCYDVHDPERLRRVERAVLGYRVEGQRSACECWLSPGELQALLAELRQHIDAGIDKVQLFTLDPRQRPRCYGQARHFQSRSFMVV